jgi:hypothetical protein
VSPLPHVWVVQQTHATRPTRYVGAAADREAAEALIRFDYSTIEPVNEEYREFPTEWFRDEDYPVIKWVRDDTSSTIDWGGGMYPSGKFLYVAHKETVWTDDEPGPGPDEPTRVRRLSLVDAAEEFREANTRANAARDVLRAAVLRELAARRPEAAVARTAGVDRMTVRRWAGKRGTP